MATCSFSLPVQKWMNRGNCFIFFIHIQPRSSPLLLCALSPLHIFTLTVSFLCFLNLSLWFSICALFLLSVFSQHCCASFSLYISLYLSPLLSLHLSLPTCSVALGILLFQMRCWLWNQHLIITISISHHHYHIFIYFLLHTAEHVWSFCSFCSPVSTTLGWNRKGVHFVNEFSQQTKAL